MKLSFCKSRMLITSLIMLIVGFRIRSDRSPKVLSSSTNSTLRNGSMKRENSFSG
ncbi:unnamed protein product [Schistosoma mattheei]|uniref:Uncharacterized protein n=1 Tax=Schistosoma mattheei TaxID=31246 RepID=A0A3P8KM86_9TREM|nr:unnamed protein product [Schistosoma mattheei]